MTERMNCSVARVRSEGGEVVGAAFLAGAGRLLTCAHVVCDALGLSRETVARPEGSVTLDFPLLPGRPEARAGVAAWDPDQDIAGLRLAGEAPAGAQAAPLVVAADPWGHRLRALGFPKGYDEMGTWVKAEALGRNAAGLLQIEKVGEAGYLVRPGFSGGPVWDDEAGGVIGMVTLADLSAGVRAAFVRPAAALVGSWEGLALSGPGMEKTGTDGAAPRVDFLILTALEEEQDAVLAKLYDHSRVPPSTEDVRCYYEAWVPVDGPGVSAAYRVVVTCLLEMGQSDAATAAGDAIRRWRPRYLILVGIAGGVARNGAALGDLLVASQVVDYELQKLTPQGPQFRWRAYPVDPRLQGAALNFKPADCLSLLAEKRPESGVPKRHIGPIATGNKVIADEAVLDELLATWPKLIGVEMESGGAAMAAQQAAEPPGFFMVRAASDLADPEKGSARVEGWRAYARDLAASYLIGLLRSGPVPRGLPLTVQGVGPPQMEALARQIVAALRAEAELSIVGTGEGLTVLAVEGEPRVVVSEGQQRALLARSRDDLERYLAGLVMHRDFAPWERHYVPLGATTERPVTPEGWAGQVPLALCALERRGEGAETRLERIDIPDVAAAVRDYCQFVLLGEPGAGKSTVLRKVALEAARRRLRDENAPVPLFVHLGGHRGGESPYDFLASRWRARVGEGWREALQQGQVLLLLDALNEMPRAGRADRMADWRAFAREWEGVRMVFSCRTLDYQNPLGLQQVEIKPLDEGRIQNFLALHLPAHAEALWKALRGHPHKLLELACNPFMLAVISLVYARDPERGLPPNRGRLLEELVEDLLERESKRNHPDWPGAEALAGALAQVAWRFQGRGEGTSLPAEELLALVPAEVTVRNRPVALEAEAVLRLGCSATLLEENLEGQVRFYHHLMQEYFAARELLRRFKAKEELRALWQIPWREKAMPEPEGLGEWEPLPPPPGTGWEETSIVAAGLASEPEGLVAAIRAHNLVLAGRCLAEGGVAADTLQEGLKGALLARLTDGTAHLRARIAAGHLLGRLGDPRFEVQERNGVRYIPPRLVPVPAGEYRIGSTRWDREADKDERPRRKVRLAAFAIGKYPVTVGEYRCFLEAWGYRTERYWETEAARAWLGGADPGGGPVQEQLELRQFLLASNKPLEAWARERSWAPQTLQGWQRLTAMSEEEARERLAAAYRARSREAPHLWGDPAYAGANRPVVGVTWFEARAYCAWLSEAAGRPFRLPTEAEWEAAVRGGSAWRYPWRGRFEAGRANTVEGRVLGTTPVGAYPGGRNARGLEDGAGNVWEWTGSLYRPYPYRPDDGREEPEGAGRRVARGGGWGNGRGFARCACRFEGHPDAYVNSLGFRVVSPVSPPAES